MNLKTGIIAAIVALVVSGGLWLALPAKSGGTNFSAVSQAITEAAGTVLPNGVVLPNPTTLDYVVARTYLAVQGALGLGNGTSVPTHIQVVRSTITSATTTPCVVQDPFTATSTLINASINITTSTSSAAQLVIATSTSQYATTTSGTPTGGSASTIFTGALAANALGTFLVGETASSTGLGIILPASTTPPYVVFGTGVGSAVAYGYTFVGTCEAVFETVN